MKISNEIGFELFLLVNYFRKLLPTEYRKLSDLAIGIIGYRDIGKEIAKTQWKLK
jgi:hypothetical protein